jgi:hypothetical protein
LVEVGDVWPKSIDIITAGGGQDSGQQVILEDLKKRSSDLRKMADDGVVMLTICGMYQLFGYYFKTADNQTLDGVGIFKAHTEAKDRRLIGNIVTSSPFGRLVGFENHSGQTFLESGQLPLGKVTKGFGNNETDDKEGAVTNNVFGTYLHGPLLPKNPHFADQLLKKAIEHRYGQVKLKPVDDSIAIKAADIAARRP